MSSVTETIPVTFAGLDRRGIIPAWARDFHATRSTVADLCGEAGLRGVSVVQSSRPQKLIECGERLTLLFTCLLRASDQSARLVLGFQKAEDDEMLDLAPLLGQIPGLAGRVELAPRADDLRDTLIEAFTKVLAARSGRDPLGEIKTIAEAGRALRADSGRLDAKKVADVFGISLTELARQLKVTKQRISKTPDAEALQSKLRPYERVARLRSILPEADFKAWLNTPNPHLEHDDSPISYLREGAGEQLAAFAENMLTGSPA